MFYHYQAHSLKKLAHTFSEIAAKTADPFSPLWIVVQNNEIKEWLTLQCAEYLGIFANTKFILPSEFIWSLYRLEHSEIPSHLPSDRIAIQWQLFSLLQNQKDLLDIIPALPTLTGEIDEKNLFQFCGQLADVLDQYQVYRPGMTEKWLRDELSSDHQDEVWQADLWRKLVQEWQKNKKTAHLPRRAEIFLTLKKQLKNNQFKAQLPDNLYLFGLSQHSAPFLEIITAISISTNVHLFSALFPDAPENIQPFTRQFSKPKLEQLNLLQELLKQTDAEYEYYDEREQNVQIPFIEIHSCHNKRREVEVLKNRILDVLDHNPDIHAQDILVMIPEVPEYAKIIETVFQKDQDEPALPVSRISSGENGSVAQIIDSIMELIGSSYKANDVLQLLSSEPVRLQFRISESELNEIEKWIEENRVFRELGEEAHSLYSWSRGVNQLIAGFAMEPEPLELYNHLIPYSGVVSGEQLETAVKLSKFIDLLKTVEDESRVLKVPTEWLSLIRHILTLFIPDDQKFIAQKNQVMYLLEKLIAQIELTDYQGQISFKLFKPWLQSQIGSAGSFSGRFGHGITLSTYIPYRSVPFKFIAILGMNEGVFPRRTIKPEYDLLNKLPAPGDRILKEDDAQIFLETLFAAEQHLHISYEGYEPKSNNRKLPSILVQQLMETLDEKNNLLHDNSLHSFSSSNFTTHKNYSGEAASLALKLNGQHSEPDMFISPEFKFELNKENEVIDIDDLISFFSNPARFFIKNVLNAGSYMDLKIHDDRELFQLSGLHQYALDQELFSYFRSDHSEEEIYEYLSAMAALPEGYAGKVAFDSSAKDISEMLEVISELQGQEIEGVVEIDLSMEGLKFSGHLAKVCGKKLFSYRAGKLKGKYLAEHFIKHLFLIKANKNIHTSYFICKGEKEGVDVHEFNTEEIHPAKLDDYVKWFIRSEGWMDKINFFPDTSLAYAKSIYKGDPVEKALHKAQSKWMSYNGGGDAADAYVQLIWSDTDPFTIKSFQENAIRFWNPILDLINESKKVR